MHIALHAVGVSLVSPIGVCGANLINELPNCQTKEERAALVKDTGRLFITTMASGMKWYILSQLPVANIVKVALTFSLVSLEVFGVYKGLGGKAEMPGKKPSFFKQLEARKPDREEEKRGPSRGSHGK